MVNDYDYEILNHLGKANVVVDALSRRATSSPIRYLCLRMTIGTPMLDMIRRAQVNAIKEENQKSEKVVSQVLHFDIDSRGLMNLHMK